MISSRSFCMPRPQSRIYSAAIKGDHLFKKCAAVLICVVCYIRSQFRTLSRSWSTQPLAAARSNIVAILKNPSFTGSRSPAFVAILMVKLSVS